jgi:hypothetical protein
MNADNPLGYEPTNLDATNDPADLDAMAEVYGLAANYAEHKAEAIRYRLDGRVAMAEVEEHKAEAIYFALPQWARW